MIKWLAALAISVFGLAACMEKEPDYRNSVVHLSSGAGTCSGFVVEESGLIATAAHCESSDGLVDITTFDGKKFQGKFVMIDAENDTALVRIVSEYKFQALKMRCESPAIYGEHITVIGMPADVFRWFTSWGRVAGYGPASNTIFATHNFVWLNVAGTGGNSGGPVLDSAGRVIAVLTVGLNGGSMMGGEPIKVACDMVKQYNG